MKSLTLAGAIAIALIALSAVSASAHDLFGETGKRWELGFDLEQKGDFDSAIIQYKQALQAVEKLNDPHLRACALTGTVARLEGARAGKLYIKTYGKASDSLSAALEESRNRFRQAMDKLDAEHPELANSCP
ncbi:MAG: hypothetical protein WCA35_24775 [Kovacikia sp.]